MPSWRRARQRAAEFGERALPDCSQWPHHALTLPRNDPQPSKGTADCGRLGMASRDAYQQADEQRA